MSKKFDEDFLVLPLNLERYRDEALAGEGLGGYWVCFQRDSGLFVSRMNEGNMVAPAPDQQMFAQDLIKLLNREISHGGRWIIEWTHPGEFFGAEGLSAVEACFTRTYERWVMMWMDEDGDIQFSIENEEPMWVIMANGPLQWVEQAEDGWKQWKEIMRDALAPSESQLIHRAQGETAH